MTDFKNRLEALEKELEAAKLVFTPADRKLFSLAAAFRLLAADLIRASEQARDNTPRCDCGKYRSNY